MQHRRGDITSGDRSASTAPVIRALLKKYGRPIMEEKVKGVSRGEFEMWKQAITKSGPLVGAAALVWNSKGQFLLVKHHHRTGWPEDLWVAPGGQREPTESLEDGLVREVEEETGVRIKVLRLHKLTRHVLRRGPKELMAYFAVFEAEALNEDARPNGFETLEAKWFRTPPENLAFREDYVPIIERGRWPHATPKKEYQ